MSIYIYTGQDAAADWWPEDTGFPPSFDEWNALRVHGGQPAGTFTDYLDYLGATDTAECPFCGHMIAEQPDGRYTCANCQTDWPDREALDREERVCASYIPEA